VSWSHNITKTIVAYRRASEGRRGKNVGQRTADFIVHMHRQPQIIIVERTQHCTSLLLIMFSADYENIESNNAIVTS